MAQTSRRTNTGFSYILHPNNTASIYLGGTYCGWIFVPYMSAIEETVHFMHAIEQCYVEYDKAVKRGMQ